MSFTVGVTFAPFTPEEWAHFDWSPAWRVQVDQYDITNRQPTPKVLAIVHDDAELAAIMPYLSNVWAVELGNEPYLKKVAKQMNAWYKRAIPHLRDNAFSGPIITAGTANINSDTLKQAKCSLEGIWSDIVFGWHAYSDWRSHTNELLAMLEGRPHMMTEWGYSNTGRDEANTAAMVAQDLQVFKNLGSQGAFFYQCHDGTPGTPESDMGLHAYDGHWRLAEQSLKGASL